MRRRDETEESSGSSEEIDGDMKSEEPNGDPRILIPSLGVRKTEKLIDEAVPCMMFTIHSQGSSVKENIVCVCMCERGRGGYL